MPPRKKTDEAGVVVKPPRPVHLSELCSECGQYEVHPDYTAWSCEHGTWDLANDFDSPAAGGEPRAQLSPEDQKAAWLAELSEDELLALLNSKQPPPTE